MEWRDIKGYEGYYQVSNTGLVKSVEREITFSDGRIRHYSEKILPIKEWFNNGKGYLHVSLTKHHKTKGFSVHRLVAEAFIPNPDNLPQVNHKDENKANNCSDNLEWCDQSYNNRYSSSVKVIQYTKQWDKIREWNCMTDAAISINIPLPNIVNCCEKKARSAGGFFWCYQTDDSMSNELILTKEEKEKRKRYGRISYKKNAEVLRKKSLAYYYSHRERYLERRRDWLKRNPEKKELYNERNRIRFLQKMRNEKMEITDDSIKLVLKKKWYSKIASGEKIEEYRDLKPYYAKRLLATAGSDGNVAKLSTVESEWYMDGTHLDILKREMSAKKVLCPYKYVTFFLGYAKDRPKMTLPIVGVEIREGRKEWGAEEGKEYFVIKLESAR